MGHWNLGKSIKRLCARGDVVHGVNYLGTVVTHAALITNTDRNSLKYDEALLVLKRLLINLLRPDSTLTVLARVAVWGSVSGIC